MLLPKVILASGSPRRKQLLAQADIAFSVLVPNTAEEVPAHVSLEQVPAAIASEKALAAKAMLNSNDAIIIAADTVVVLHNKIIGKPTSAENAVEILTSLQGQTHTVITGVTILFGEQRIVFSETTLVTMVPLSLKEITYYVRTYKPFDKAGAYAIQEWIGAVAIEKIEGCYYNVMGLPIQKVYGILKQFEIKETA